MKTKIFKNTESEASYWEKNFDKEWKTAKPVTVKISKNLSETINVRFDSTTISNIREIAKAKGLRPTQLIRMWTKEGLNQTAS